jgi:transcription elongation factor/antiterminator RfaH
MAETSFKGVHLSDEPIQDVLRWYVIRTLPRQEDRAERNLKAWNIETLNPLVKEYRSNQYSGRRFYVTKSLFPRYIFARFVESRLLNKVSFTRGVHSVLTYGTRPTFVEDEIIATIQDRIGEDGFVMLGDEFKAGDKVTIRDGSLKSFSGVFLRNLKNTQRVEILLASVSYHGRVLTNRSSVVKSG